MGALSETSRFLELAIVGLALYLAYGYSVGHEVELLAVALFFAGSLAVVLLTLQFAEDFALEDEDD